MLNYTQLTFTEPLVVEDISRTKVGPYMQSRLRRDIRLPAFATRTSEETECTSKIVNYEPDPNFIFLDLMAFVSCEHVVYCHG